jgi:hypothetical protein
VRIFSSRCSTILLLISVSILLHTHLCPAAEIKLAWNSNTEDDLAGYNVYYGISSGVYDYVVDARKATQLPDNVTTYTLNGLTLGQTYFIVVTAYDSSGNESEYSNEVLGTAKGVVEILAPGAAEPVPSGSAYTIEWWAVSEAAYFKLSYSTNDGITWKPIPGGEHVIGTSFPWTIPTPMKNKKQCRIRVKGYDAIGKKIGTATSNLPFSIEVVKLREPNGGETLGLGDWQPITWYTNATRNPVDHVKLFYSKDGGMTWNLITPLDGNPGSYVWEVPSVHKTKTKCKVRVVLKDIDRDSVGADASDDYFTIEP